MVVKVTTTQPQRSQTATVTVSVPNKKKKTSKNSRRRLVRKLRKSRALVPKDNERSFFRLALLSPDLTGPVRMPRLGAARTGLGFDTTDFGLVLANSANARTVQASSIYSGQSMTWWTAADINTNNGAGTTAGPSAQFPTAAQIADVNLVACSIVVYYIGNPLNVAGEILIGSTIPLSNNASYQALWYYPGVVRIPVAQLIQKPLRISARKLSPTADEFVATNLGNQDYDLPFISVTGMPTTGQLQVVVTRTWEYRSTTNTGSVIPYERVGESHVVDTNALQNAKADISQMSLPLTEAMPEKAMGTLSDYLGLGPVGSSMLGVAGLAAGVRAYHLNRARGMLPQQGLEMNNFADIEAHIFRHGR